MTASRAGHALAFVLALTLATGARSARGDEVGVVADTHFQAYEVRSPGTVAFMARRRLVQTLGATWARELGSDASRRRPRVDVALRLRLDQDFGDTCLLSRDLCAIATDPEDPGFYQPLAQDTEVDAPEAWVRVRGLPAGIEARAGRHARFDPEGIARLDGASARAAPLAWLAAEVFAGSLVRRTSLAGTHAFEPQGIARLDAGDVAPDRLPFVDDPTITWIAGGGIELGAAAVLRGRVGYRELFERDGLVSRRASLALRSVPHEAVRLSATGVLDLIARALSDAHFTAEAEPVEALTIGASLERRVPNFDAGSVWAYFDLAPVTELRLEGALSPTRRFSAGVALRGREARFDGGQVERDLGGDAFVAARIAGFGLHGAASAWGGDLGPVASVLVSADRRLGSRVRLAIRASAWHFDDPLRAGLHGTSLSEALGLALDLSEVTRVGFELEHATSPVAGHRFRGLAHLHVEVWR